MKRFSMLDYTQDELPPSQLDTLFRLPTGDEVKQACKALALPLDGRLRIAMFPAAENACGYYRMVIPARELNKSYADKVVVRTFGAILPEVLRWADIIVVQELHTLQPFSFLERFAYDRIVISEFDDNILAIPPTNPYYKEFNPSSQGAYIWTKMLARADAHQVSTEPLAEWVNYRAGAPNFSINGRIAVLPNSIPEREIEPIGALAVYQRDVVGWAGGNNHLDDLPVLNEPLTAIQKDREIRFRMLGWDGWYKDVQTYNALPSVDIDIHIPPVRPELFVKTLHALDLDLGLAPLADTEFNQSRSNIKLLHYAAAGIPAIASDVGPYKNFPGVLAIGPGDWRDAMEAILDDHTLSSAMLQEARQAVIEHYTIERNIHRWYSFYTGIYTEFIDKIEGRVEE